MGNWKFEPDGTWHIWVSEMDDWRYMFLVARHELDEMALCKHRGIREEDVSEFDIQFEKERELGLHRQDEECGDAVDAPYRDPHFIATNNERTMSVPLDVIWHKYDETVMSL